MARKRGSATVPPVESATAVEQATDRERLAADLRHLNDLLERERIEEARRYVKELQQRWPDAERVQHYAHVLAPPVARSRPDLKTRPMHRELAWVREHAHEHPGCWLAVFEDRLVAADPDLQVVLAKTREALGHENVLVVQAPKRSDAR
jgi:Family of unknown function (DUF5678)